MPGTLNSSDVHDLWEAAVGASTMAIVAQRRPFAAGLNQRREDIVLTQTQMEGFVTALPEVVAGSMREAAGASDAEVQTELTAVFKAHGLSGPA